MPHIVTGQRDPPVDGELVDRRLVFVEDGNPHRAAGQVGVHTEIGVREQKGAGDQRAFFSPGIE